MTGETISHREFGDKLGEVGMGVVYGAEGARRRRPAVLKFPRSGAVESDELKTSAAIGPVLSLMPGASGLLTNFHSQAGRECL